MRHPFEDYEARQRAESRREWAITIGIIVCVAGMAGVVVSALVGALPATLVVMALACFFALAIGKGAA